MTTRKGVHTLKTREINMKHNRSQGLKLETRALQGNDELIIEGYFATFNNRTELWKGAYEQILPSAFDSSINGDIRALADHDTAKVLGRTTAGTLDLTVDNKGLYGTIKINQNDPEAVALYERVKRGDIDNCSFGFRVIEEETIFADDGTVEWRLKDVELLEVSIVTFPAYDGTSVQARKKEFDLINEKRQRESLETKKRELKERYTWL